MQVTCRSRHDHPVKWHCLHLHFRGALRTGVAAEGLGHGSHTRRATPPGEAHRRPRDTPREPTGCGTAEMLWAGAW